MAMRSLIGIILAGALAIAGCGLQPGRTIVKYEQGKEPQMAKALKTGEYALFSSTDLAGPKVRVKVIEGDKIGFMRNDAGKVVAVAGDNPEVPIDSGLAPNYYWKFER